ncbi:stage III sporulation protein AG [Biomaibacter acetigenes]|uniref:Stage III sporulation protein AG n=1 Tax=Biomaibacter acetigenes TaxID=2316383 RepID=A0A3G2R5S1_9FIRM|nr:stage III sporulation protein AG [Biomaibacter acetigenes]AYO30705.1 stage III sporulation protein AG [Biomaibacter acetigenes]
MEEKQNIKVILNWLKNPKNKAISHLIVIFAIGFLFLSLAKTIAPPMRPQDITGTDSISIAQTPAAVEQSYEERLEKQLAEVLKKVHGVGDVSIMITLENDMMVEPAFNTINSQKTSEEKDSEGGVRTVTETQSNRQVVVLRKGGEDEPLVVKKSTPMIKGVLIVADGASSSRIIEQITRAAATVLDIPVYKIKVLAK